MGLMNLSALSRRDASLDRVRSRLWVALAATSLMALSLVAVNGPADAGQPSTSANAKLCRKGGWENLVRSDGSPFASQKDCTAYALAGGTLLPKPLTPLQQCQQDITDAGVTVPADANYILGTDGADQFYDLTSAPDVICGFGGYNEIAELHDGDIYVGGNDYNELFGTMWGGTFIGGDSGDLVNVMEGGTYLGGLGNDTGDSVYHGTFYGGPGNDSMVGVGEFGTFDGGDGTDFVCNAAPGATLISVEQTGVCA